MQYENVINKIGKYFDDASFEYDKHKYNPNDPSAKTFLVRQPVLLQSIKEMGFDGGSVLDCGCGTGENLLFLKKNGFDVDGFDLSQNMVAMCKEKFKAVKITDINVWQDNICHFSGNIKKEYDIVVAMGVLQYLSEDLRADAYHQIARAVRPGGIIVLSYVNALFDLFTFNKFTVGFLKKHILPLGNWRDGEDAMVNLIKSLISYPDIGVKKGTKSETAHGYVSIFPSNPLLIADEIRLHGFDYRCTKFCHFHALPPLLKDKLSRFEEFYENSMAMEMNFAESWLGNFMAYQFLVVGKNPQVKRDGVV